MIDPTSSSYCGNLPDLVQTVSLEETGIIYHLPEDEQTLMGFLL